MQKKDILVLSGERDLNWIQAYKAFHLEWKHFLYRLLGSISSTFNVQLLCTYVARAAFLYLHFSFVFYWHRLPAQKLCLEHC
jgi:hypothetical protein